ATRLHDKSRLAVIGPFIEPERDGAAEPRACQRRALQTAAVKRQRARQVLDRLRTGCPVQARALQRSDHARLRVALGRDRDVEIQTSLALQADALHTRG